MDVANIPWNYTRNLPGIYPRYLTTIRVVRSVVTCFNVESGVWKRRNPAGNFCIRNAAGNYRRDTRATKPPPPSHICAKSKFKLHPP